MPKTYTPIATNILTTETSSVTFSSIPSTYTDLVLVVNGSSSTTISGYVRFNGDSASNYSFTYLNGDGSTATSGRVSGTQAAFGQFYTYNGTAIMNINNYSNSTTFKTMLARGNTANNYVQALVNLWRSTTAINSVTILTSSGNFLPSSTFTLYGILKA